MTVPTYEYHQKNIFEIGGILTFAGEKLQWGLTKVGNSYCEFGRPRL